MTTAKVIGQRFIDYEPDLLLKKVEDYGYAVGDLVTLQGQGLNSGGVIYKITLDSRPVNAIWGAYRDYYGRHRYMSTSGKTSYTWCYVNKKGKPAQPVPDTRLKGCIELTPVFSLFPYKKGKKVVPYKKIKSRMSKVDLIKLGVTFYEFQTFIQAETKKMMGDE